MRCRTIPAVECRRTRLLVYTPETTRTTDIIFVIAHSFPVLSSTHLYTYQQANLLVMCSLPLAKTFSLSLSLSLFPEQISVLVSCSMFVQQYA